MEEEKNVCGEKKFNEVFRAYAKDVFNFLFYKYQHRQNAEDLVQEVFSKLWDNCEKVSEDKAKGYLFVIANNMMKNILAREKVAQKHEANLKQNDNSFETPQYILEENEFSSRLNKALSDLPEEQRITLMMKKMEGKKQREIAALLNISEKAVEKRLAKAMLYLRQQLGDIL